MAQTQLRASKQINFDANVDLNGKVLTNGGTPSADSDIATVGYAKSLIGVNDLFINKGGLDCSANPNYPAADSGHTYYISVAGKIGGASGLDVVPGDLLVCNVDSSASGTQAAVGANWTVNQGAFSGGLSTSNFVTRETPSGTMNGSNTVFTLANTPTAGTEQVHLNGWLQNAGATMDYTISGSTITFVEAPVSTNVILVNYIK